MWVFPKIVVPPNHPFVHRVFHYKPSILGVFPLFLETPIVFCVFCVCVCFSLFFQKSPEGPEDYELSWEQNPSFVTLVFGRFGRMMFAGHLHSWQLVVPLFPGGPCKKKQQNLAGPRVFHMHQDAMVDQERVGFYEAHGRRKKESILLHPDRGISGTLPGLFDQEKCEPILFENKKLGTQI